MRRWGLLLAVVVGSLGASPAAVGHPAPNDQLHDLGDRIDAAPDDVELRLRRAELRRRLGHPRGALTDLAVAARHRPDDRAIWLERALALSALGRRRAAEQLLDRFLAAGQPSTTALAERARLREADGREDAARADLDAAIALQATPELVLARGRLDAHRGRFDDEALGYEQGLAVLGPAVVVQLALVDAHRRRGEPQAALDSLDALQADTPVRADWILVRAEILDELGHHASASVERLRAMIEADSAARHRPTPLHRLTQARVYFALGMRAQARETLDRVLADAPDLAAAQSLEARLDARLDAPATVP